MRGIDAKGCDPGAFKAAMRRLVGGVSIITVGHGDERRGLTATAVCSVSVDPPTVLACVNRSAEAHDVILEAGWFSISLLTDGQRALAETFSARDGTRGVERFARGRWRESERHAGPILADAVASLECRLLHSVGVGTHTILIAAVEQADYRSSGRPLAYVDGDFCAVVRPGSGSSTGESRPTTSGPVRPWGA